MDVLPPAVTARRQTLRRAATSSLPTRLAGPYRPGRALAASPEVQRSAGPALGSVVRKAAQLVSSGGAQATGPVSRAIGRGPGTPGCQAYTWLWSPWLTLMKSQEPVRAKASPAPVLGAISRPGTISSRPSSRLSTAMSEGDLGCPGPESVGRNGRESWNATRLPSPLRDPVETGTRPSGRRLRPSTRPVRISTRVTLHEAASPGAQAPVRSRRSVRPAASGCPVPSGRVGRAPD